MGGTPKKAKPTLEVISLRVAPQTWEQVKKEAADKGLTPSDWLRGLIDEALESRQASP